MPQLLVYLIVEIFLYYFPLLWHVPRFIINKLCIKVLLASAGSDPAV